jgi:predicted nucleic acid-binding protein
VLVVDTCILVDIADDDPSHGLPSAECLATHLADGLVLSPISYVELAPVFDGSTQRLHEFLAGVGVAVSEDGFTAEDRVTSFRAWARHITEKRAGRVRRRPVADALIGALATRHDGIITRNGTDFRSFYPNLRVVDPGQEAAKSSTA